jgi:hypothetical protein
MANKREADVAGKFKPKYEETPQSTPEKPVAPGSSPATTITSTGNPGRATGADIMNEMLWGQKESPEERVPATDFSRFFPNLPNYNNDMSGRLLKMAQGNTAEQNALAREYRKGSTPRWQELFDNSQKSYWDDNIGQLYGIKATNAMGDTLGTMAADNGGNIDSYAAANANQQYLSYLDKGINAMINQANAQQANGYNALTGWGNTNANVISALGESLSPMISGAGNAYATEAQNLANTYDYLNNANQAANDYMAALYGTGSQGQEVGLGQSISSFLKGLMENDDITVDEYLNDPGVLVDYYLKYNPDADRSLVENSMRNQLANLYWGSNRAYENMTVDDIIGQGFSNIHNQKEAANEVKALMKYAERLKESGRDNAASKLEDYATQLRVMFHIHPNSSLLK